MLSGISLLLECWVLGIFLFFPYIIPKNTVREVIMIV